MEILIAIVAGAIFSLFFRGANNRGVKSQDIDNTKTNHKRLIAGLKNTPTLKSFKATDFNEKQLITLYLNGDELQGKITKIDPTNQEIRVIIEKEDPILRIAAEHTFSILLKQNINNEGISLHSDDKLLNPRNKIAIPNSRGALKEHSIGDTEIITSKFLIKENNRLKKKLIKSASSGKVNYPLIYRLKVIEKELERRKNI